MKKYLKKFFEIHSGVTLIEIVVVIAIISIILVFAAPNYYRSVENSYFNDCMEQMRIIHAADRLYKAKTGGLHFADSEPTSSYIEINGINNVLNLSLVNLKIKNEDKCLIRCYRSPSPEECLATAVKKDGTDVTIDLDLDRPLSTTNPENPQYY